MFDPMFLLVYIVPLLAGMVIGIAVTWFSFMKSGGRPALSPPDPPPKDGRSPDPCYGCSQMSINPWLHHHTCDLSAEADRRRQSKLRETPERGAFTDEEQARLRNVPDYCICENTHIHFVYADDDPRGNDCA